MPLFGRLNVIWILDVPRFWWAMFVHCWEMLMLMLMLCKDCYFPKKTIQRHISFKMFLFVFFCRTQIDAQLTRLNSKQTHFKLIWNKSKNETKLKLWWIEINATQNTWSRTKRVFLYFVFRFVLMRWEKIYSFIHIQ